VVLLPVLLPLPRLQAALDVDLLPLGEIRLQRLGTLAPPHDAVALCLLLLLAVLRRPVLRRRDAEAGDRRAAGRIAHFRIPTEIAHQNHFVHTAHGSTLPFLIWNDS